MKIEVVTNTGKSRSSPIELYASRFARRCLLERMLPPDHPVLKVEHQLIDEAKKRLHEHLLQHKWSRVDLENQIRRHASNRIAFLTEDSSVLKIVVTDIWTKSLDEAFPDVN